MWCMSTETTGGSLHKRLSALMSPAVMSNTQSEVWIIVIFTVDTQNSFLYNNDGNLTTRVTNIFFYKLGVSFSLLFLK